MNWQRIKEEGELFGTYYPRSAQMRDEEIITAHQEDKHFWYEFYWACRQELFDLEVKRLISLLRPQHPTLIYTKVKAIVIEYLTEENYPKDWRIKKYMTLKRKEIKQQRGY